MRCSAVVYEGTESYIFISYCHQDSARVYPYIEALSRAGYRLWYDEGITPGDEWTENIAKHLEGSSVFVAFITEASLNSHNCRREINYAVQRNKNFVSLFLDDVRMSGGMALLLSSVQGIYRSKYDSAEDYIRKLCGMAVMDQCCRGSDLLDPILDEFDDDETVTLTQGVPGYIPGDLETYLLRVSNQEKIRINKSIFTMGRSRNYSDYAFTGESSVSRKHATIRKVRDTYMITDEKSLNHVCINGRLITPEVEYEISGYDIISLAKEHLIFFKDYNESGLKLLPNYVLEDGRQIWNVGSLPVTRIGSQDAGADGYGNEICVSGSGIMPFQALLLATSDGLCAVDIAGNRNTAVNGRPLMFCEKRMLKSGDTLSIGERTFKVIRRV